MNYAPLNSASWKWVQERLPLLLVEDTSGVAAYDDAGEVVAACVMDNWTENSVQCSFVIDNPMVLRGGFLKFCCSFIFEDQCKNIIYAQVAENNEAALKFDKHIGFTRKCLLEDAFEKGVGCVILELKKENCRYLLDEVA